jgi:hypothetical protein
MKGGASTPAGAMANIQDTLTPAIATGLDFARTEADVGLKEAQQMVTDTDNTLKRKDLP